MILAFSFGSTKNIPTGRLMLAHFPSLPLSPTPCPSLLQVWLSTATALLSYQGTGQLTFDQDERLKRLNLIYAACCGLIALSCLCTFVSSPLRDRQECMPSTMRRCIMSEVFGNLTGSCYPAVPVDEDSGYSWCLEAPRSGQC